MLLNGQTPTGLSRQQCGTAQPTFGLSLKGKSNRVARYIANDEPCLDDVMHDDIIRQVMDRDGVDPEQLLSMMNSVRVALG